MKRDDGMMRRMKDSGIEWIGEMPENWGIARLSYFFDIQLGKMLQPERKEYTDTYEYYLCAANLGGNRLKIDDMKQMWFSSSDKEKFDVHKGDLLVVEGGDVASCDVIVTKLPNVYIQNALHRVRSKNQSEIRLLRYYLMSAKNCGFIDLICNKATIAHFTKEKFAKMPYLVIPIYQQKQISDFLDIVCIQIDSILNKTRTAIEEYKKLKQSIITQAVTKGIRPNRKMKDSGIEWIGEIPEEWDVMPFRHVLHERNEKNNPIKSKERLSLSIDLGITLYAEKTTNLDRFKDDFNQYKLAHVGDLVMNSMNMIVGATGVSGYYGCISPAYYTFYDDLEDHATAKYCEYIFRSKSMLRVLFSYGKGIYAIVRGDDRVNTCRLKIAREDLRTLSLPVPSINEQREIIFYLDTKISEINNLITKKEQLLTELENYKKSLIFEYVTGKKAVLQ